MDKSGRSYQTYVEILKRELICAMGCTEPIAIAYCASQARKLLGCLPERIEVQASGNIIKNVKSVVVPNSGGRRGIQAAAALGALAGDPEAELLVIAKVSKAEQAALTQYLARTPIPVSDLNEGCLLDIIVTVRAGASYARARIADQHTNLVLLEKDGAVVLQKAHGKAGDDRSAPDYALLNVADILDFAETCDLSDVRDLLMQQIARNTAISEEGLRHSYGANVGKTLLAACGDQIRVRAKARAAAGSDARMNGCDLPVVINSGSGNQGLTASLPVIEYARELAVGEEKMLRALLISNLVTLHEKSEIGRLSAFCGAVCAGAGAGAGIAYLSGGGLEAISHTIVNALAVTSGIVCDGAKSSCAAKIATAVEAGIFGYEMYCAGQGFCGGEGLVADGVERSIQNFGRLGREGMKETDREIIRMMIGNGGGEKAE